MTVHSAITGNRVIRPIEAKSRKKCSCCGNRATHKLYADGAVMGISCELFGRRWVKDARKAYGSLLRLGKLKEKP